MATNILKDFQVVNGRYLARGKTFEDSMKMADMK
jgi:hypothetical protein